MVGARFITVDSEFEDNIYHSQFYPISERGGNGFIKNSPRIGPSGNIYPLSGGPQNLGEARIQTFKTSSEKTGGNFRVYWGDPKGLKKKFSNPPKNFPKRF